MLLETWNYHHILMVYCVNTYRGFQKNSISNVLKIEISENFVFSKLISITIIDIWQKVQKIAYELTRYLRDNNIFF